MSCLLVSWVISILLSTSIVLVRPYIRIIPNVILIILVMTPQIIFILILLYSVEFPEKEDTYQNADEEYDRDTYQDTYQDTGVDEEVVMDTGKETGKETSRVRDAVRNPVGIVIEKSEETRGLLERELENEYHIL